MSAVTGIARICPMPPRTAELPLGVPTRARTHHRAPMIRQASSYYREGVPTLLNGYQSDRGGYSTGPTSNLMGSKEETGDAVDRTEQSNGITVLQPSDKESRSSSIRSRKTFEEKDEFSDSVAPLVIKSGIRLECETHTRQPCSVYCFTCATPICEECSLAGHASHQTGNMCDVITERCGQLRELVECLDIQIDRLNETRIKLANMNRADNSIMFTSSGRRSSLSLLPRRFSSKHRTGSVGQKLTSAFRRSVYGSSKRLSVEHASVSGELTGRKLLLRSSTVDRCSTDSFPELSTGTPSNPCDLTHSIGKYRDSTDAASCQSIEELQSTASDELFNDSTYGGSSNEVSAGENSISRQKTGQKVETVNLSEVTVEVNPSLTLPCNLQPGVDKSKTIAAGHRRRKLSIFKDILDLRIRRISAPGTKSAEGESEKLCQSAPVEHKLANMDERFPHMNPMTLKPEKTIVEKSASRSRKNSKPSKGSNRATLATFEDFETEEADDTIGSPIIFVVEEVDKGSSTSEDFKQSGSSSPEVEKSAHCRNFLKVHSGSRSQEALPLHGFATLRSSSYTSLASFMSFNSVLKRGSVPSDEELKRDDQISEKITALSKLCRLAGRTLESSPNEDLFLLYQQLVSSIQSAVDLEIPKLSDTLEHKLIEAMSRSVDQKELERKSKKAVTSELGKLRGSMRRKTVPTYEGSPMRVASTKSPLVKPQLLWKIDRQSSELDEICNPSGVTILQDGAVVVASYDNSSQSNNRLLHIDKSGQTVKTLTGGDIQPLGVVQTLSGHLAVTDCKGKRVRIISQTGQSISDFGKGHFGWPYGITINSKGQLIVSDVFNDTISIYSVDGRRIRTFGASGSVHPSQFRNPYHVTVDWNDNIVVSDYGNNCVKIFEGDSCKLLYSISDRFRRISAPVGSNLGSLINRGHLSIPSKCATSPITASGSNPSRLKSPRGLTVDISGNILVADDCAGVCAFDYCGRFLRNVLSEDDAVKRPEAIFMDRDGLLVVTECNANNGASVQMFRVYE